MAEKNYYDVLGVAKDADLNTIKKAYRKLVRQYHPDVSKDPDAVKKTAEVNEAYEILKDQEKRAEYDEMLANPYGAAQGANPFSRGNPFGGEGGGFHRYEFHSDGDGAFGQANFNFEDLFGSFGRTAQARARQTGPIKGDDQHAEFTIDIATAYNGAARSVTLNVPTLDKYGHGVYQAKTLNIKIPKGITEGQQIRLSGQGLPGLNGGENGDLYLKIKFDEKPDLYVKNKKDVYQIIDVKPWDAVLGGKIIADTVAGRLQINLPENSQSGKSIRLKGKGIPAKEAGDLYLNIRIVVPSVQSDADRAAWKALATHFNGKTA